jgi:hypothetical protein
MFDLVRKSAVALFLLATALSIFSSDFQIEWKDKHVEVVLPSGIYQSVRTNWTTLEMEAGLSVATDVGEILSVSKLPSLAGTYSLDGNILRFDPQFPLVPGLKYRAVIRPQKLGATNEIASATLVIPVRRQDPSTIVSAIYPSSSTLPENLLKFYVHFSAPMSGGHVYDHIQLIDTATGKPVELPFLEIDEELWDPFMTRLTLFLDPGRIKRGVRPLEEIGPSFNAGKTYALIISTTWQDAHGVPLKTGFEKKFTVTPPDRTPPNPKLWKISPPTAASAPLEIQFEKPLDHAIIQRRVVVLDPAGKLLPGSVEISDEERHWRFTPNSPWKSGSYEIQVPTLIEDIAGNNVGKPFDLDLLEDKQQLASEYVKLPFAVK